MDNFSFKLPTRFVFGRGTEGETGLNNVEAYISFLRKKLAFLKSDVSIDTIRMLGYRLSYPEQAAEPENDEA